MSEYEPVAYPVDTKLISEVIARAEMVAACRKAAISETFRGVSSEIINLVKWDIQGALGDE